ncbi:hypothetical protein ACFQV8_37650 [Pseudonocardia benzenivorans]
MPGQHQLRADGVGRVEAALGEQRVEGLAMQDVEDRPGRRSLRTSSIEGW